MSFQCPITRTKMEVSCSTCDDCPGEVIGGVIVVRVRKLEPLNGGK
jgi:hypothetical protein